MFKCLAPREWHYQEVWHYQSRYDLVGESMSLMEQALRSQKLKSCQDVSVSFYLWVKM